MKEKFEHRPLSGSINVKCKNEDGSFRMWTTRKEIVIQRIVDTVNKYRKLGFNLTLRQLHYQLVSVNAIVNHQTAYKKLGTILDDCRYSGVIDWSMIEDRGRKLDYPYYEDSVSAAIQKTANYYRLERQLGQRVHIEVWTEKDALSQIFGRVTNKYGVGLCVNKGYTSSSAIYKAYERFADRFDNGQSVVILYFGDHDPSGLDMVRDIEDRLRFMFDNGQLCSPDYDFAVIPIGLTMQQIKKYNLPENPAKLTDTRSASYVQKFGTKSWEVDALSPEVLTEIVDYNINNHMDILQFETLMETEKEQIEAMKEIAKNYKND